MESIDIKPLKNLNVDNFITKNNLFVILNGVPANFVFLDNFVNNINKYRDVFLRYCMHENIFFSCKANKSIALLFAAAKEKCGIEVSSYYELKDALKYTKKIIASGPAKDEQYLSLAIENKSIISVDDIEELKQILSFNQQVNVMFRISDLLGITSRFGINISQIDLCIEMIKNTKINLLGFSFHINNYDLNDRIQAINQLVNIVKQKNLKIKYIDIGGGIPINYCTKEEYSNFMKKNNRNMFFKEKAINNFYPYYNKLAGDEALDYILKSIKDNIGDIQIVIEPGRSLLNNCGISIFEVQYVKQLSNGDNLIITNGNINCLSEQWFNTDYLISPMLYKKNKNTMKKPIIASVCGNLCLEQDMITWRKVRFEDTPEKGDLLIYYNTAGYQMDSNESMFHKIPLVEKYIVEINDDKYKIRKDNLYDSK